MIYDPNNIFAKILRGEIPCQIVFESPYSLAFRDIAPKAPFHALLIPKGPYICFDHFVTHANATEQLDFNQSLSNILIQNNLCIDGYRLISNAGEHGLQEVPHYHVHILGGCVLGGLLPPA